jgi:hypothetical protein
MRNNININYTCMTTPFFYAILHYTFKAMLCINSWAKLLYRTVFTFKLPDQYKFNTITSVLAVQFNSIQFSSIQSNPIQSNPVQFNSIFIRFHQVPYKSSRPTGHKIQSNVHLYLLHIKIQIYKTNNLNTVMVDVINISVHLINWSD